MFVQSKQFVSRAAVGSDQQAQGLKVTHKSILMHGLPAKFWHSYTSATGVYNAPICICDKQYIHSLQNESFAVFLVELSLHLTLKPDL